MWILLIIAGIGYKPINGFIGQSNLCGYTLLCEAENKHIILSEGDTLSKTQEKKDISWIITEPMGGVVGGTVGEFLGGYLGFAAGALWAYVNNIGADGGPWLIGWAIGTRIGHPIGVSWGICKVGKWLEKEEGSFRKTLIGAIIGEIIRLGFISLQLSEYHSILTILMSSPGTDYWPAPIFINGLPLMGGDDWVSVKFEG